MTLFLKGTSKLNPDMFEKDTEQREHVTFVITGPLNAGPVPRPSQPQLPTPEAKVVRRV
jgi:hypothetical protein